MESQNTQQKRTVADKVWALRFTGDMPVHLSGINAESLNDGFTIEAWVRPSAVERGVLVFPEERFYGNGVAFGPGRYDDLAHFRVGSQAIKSLRVPPGYQAILFTGKGCTGTARTIGNDVISLGDEWNNSAHSLLVLDLTNATQSYAVVYQEPNFVGAAAVLNLRRYEALTFLPPAQASFASMLIPTGLEVTLYDRPRCQGVSSVQQGAVADLGDWTGRVHSLALNKSSTADAAMTVTPPSPAAQYAQIFVAASGDGLSLDIAPSSSPVRPPDVLFASKKLRPDRWHHLAQTFDGTHIVAFVNGRAVQTSQPDTAPNLGGEWTMGNGFYGDIGVVSLRRGARPPEVLQKKRFNLPQLNETDPPDASDQTALHAAWILDGSGSEGLVELLTGSITDLPAGEAFWVAAQLPRSLLESGLGLKALSLAKQRSNAAVHQAHSDGQATLDKAHQKAQRKRREAHVKAQANAHASRIEDIRSIFGGAMTKAGPDGKILETPVPWANAVFSDIDVDASTGFTYLAYRRENGNQYSVYRLWQNETGRGTELLFNQTQPIHALALDSAGEHGQKYVYWIEGAGTLCRGPAKPGSEAAILLPLMIPGRDGEWHMVFDPRHQRLFWSNGREIWRGTPTGDNQLADWRVVVSHGRSPHPIALTIDDETGDLFWLDKDLEMVRTCDSDGNNIRNLYEALDPREGIALDYFDLSKLSAGEPAHPALTLKRLYWNAEYRKMVEAAVIDDAGLFCWLQHLEGQARPQNNIEALEDVHFIGTKWVPNLDVPQNVENEEFYLFFHTPDSGLHALGIDRRLTIFEWDAATRKRKPLFVWDRDKQGNPPMYIAADQTGSMFIYSNRKNTWRFDSKKNTHISLKEHTTNIVQAVAVSTDGKLGVLGSDILSVVDVVSGEWVRNLEGHDGGITCVLTYAIGDKQYALSGSYDNTVKNWDLATGNCLQTLKGHSNMISGIDITQDRKRVVSSSFDGTLMVWDLTSGACLQTLKGHTSKFIYGITIYPGGNKVVSSSTDKTLKVWDMTSGVCLRTLEGHDGTVRSSAVTDDGRHLISTADDQKTLQWDLNPPAWALLFNGKSDYVDLGPLFLNCEQGFSVELQLRLNEIAGAMTLFSLGNGRDGDNINFTLFEDGGLTFGVEHQGAVKEIATGRDSLSVAEWHTISLAVDGTGFGVIHIDGAEAGDGQVALPRTCLRLQNEIGRSNLDQSAYLDGKIGMLRLWNRALTLDEIEKFHRDPLSAPNTPLPNYDRSVLEYRNGRPYLMSGMSDGSTPPIPMFELAVDKGLAIQSKSNTVHAKLLAAQHDKQAADENAAADREKARREAQATVNAAHARNQADHAHAQHLLDTAHADAAQKRAEAQRNLAAKTREAQRKVEDAKADAQRQKAEADQQAQRIKDDAQRKADNITRAANKNLQDAQAEKERARNQS